MWWMNVKNKSNDLMWRICLAERHCSGLLNNSRNISLFLYPWKITIFCRQSIFIRGAEAARGVYYKGAHCGKKTYFIPVNRGVRFALWIIMEKDVECFIGVKWHLYIVFFRGKRQFCVHWSISWVNKRARAETRKYLFIRPLSDDWTFSACGDGRESYKVRLEITDIKKKGDYKLPLEILTNV